MAVVDEYLDRLRSSLEARDVVAQLEALGDAREFLESELWACRRARPELSEAEAFALVTAKYGTAEEIAQAYDEGEGDSLLKTYHRFCRALSYAPGWKIRCPVCGRSGDLRASAPLVLRIGWALGAATIGWCSRCRRLRLMRIWKA